jgi:hypothetical protein
MGCLLFLLFSLAGSPFRLHYSVEFSNLGLTGVDACLGSRVAHFFRFDTLVLEIFAVLEFVVLGSEVLVGGSVVLLEASVADSSAKLRLHHAAEVNLTEDAVVRHVMVHGCSLKVVQVLEVTGVGVTEEEGHKGSAIVNGVAVLTLKIS